jgi:hypothetical protein
VKRPYFFGYLFVRARKELALLVISIGIGYCVLEYSQANASASATAYRPSTSLQRALSGLTDSFSATERVVNAFNTDHQLTTPKVQPPVFPKVVGSDGDFALVDEALSNIDWQREALKQSIVSRFETLLAGIEGKLRAHAAGVKGVSAAQTPSTGAVVVTTAPTVEVQGKPKGSVFSAKLPFAEVTKRGSDLNAQMEFLQVLKSKAQNPQNRANLTEAVAQLDALSKLLPEKAESPESPASGPNQDEADLGSKLLPSERVALQLQQLRGQVRQIFLTSWTVDDAFQQAAELTSVERDKCRVATLAQKGIWLSTTSRILVALLVAVLASFVILVCADLVKTFLDTASHTGVVADAINAMRGATVIAKNQVRQQWPADGNDTHTGGNGNP